MEGDKEAAMALSLISRDGQGNENDKVRDFPGDLVAKTPHSQSGGRGGGGRGPCLSWIPGQGTGSHMTQLKIPQATTKDLEQPNQ